MLKNKNNDVSKLLDKIVLVPDFPVKGIVFWDIIPIVADGYTLYLAIEKMFGLILKLKTKPTKIVSPEARGFIFGSILAYKLGIGMVLVRKINKIPRMVSTVSYSLEYGKEYLEIQSGILESGDKVLIVDDLIASGGTIEACRRLIKLQGAISVGAIVLVDINLKSKKIDSSLKLFSVISDRKE